MKKRRTERVSLGEEPSTGVDDPLPAVRPVSVTDELVSFSGLGESESVVSDEFVRGEAVVKLDDLYIVDQKSGG